MNRKFYSLQKKPTLGPWQNSDQAETLSPLLRDRQKNYPIYDKKLRSSNQLDVSLQLDGDKSKFKLIQTPIGQNKIKNYRKNKIFRNQIVVQKIKQKPSEEQDEKKILPLISTFNQQKYDMLNSNSTNRQGNIQSETGEVVFKNHISIFSEDDQIMTQSHFTIQPTQIKIIDDGYFTPIQKKQNKKSIRLLKSQRSSYMIQQKDSISIQKILNFETAIKKIKIEPNQYQKKMPSVFYTPIECFKRRSFRSRTISPYSFRTSRLLD